MTNLTSTSIAQRWWFLIIIINAIFLTFTTLAPFAKNFPQVVPLFSLFTLAYENNIAVWWSGMSLLLVALLIINKFSYQNLPWLIIALILMGLSLDEIGSIHERVSIWKGWDGILPFGILLVCLAFYSIIKIYLNKQFKRSSIYLLIGFSLFGLVAGQEYIEHLYSWKDLKSGIGSVTGEASSSSNVQHLNILKNLLSGLRVGIEEGTELLGIFFLFIAILTQNNKKLSAKALIPKFETFLNLRVLLLIGLIIHIVGSYICVKYIDLSRRGNPMNWYPAAVFFSLFLFSVKSYLELKNKRRKVWVLLFILCLLSSISIMTIPNIYLIMFPGIENIISAELIQEKFLLFYLVQLIIIVSLLFDSDLLSKKSVLIGTCLIFVLIILSIWGNNPWVRYSVLGIHAFFVFQLMCMKIQSKHLNAKF